MRAHRRFLQLRWGGKGARVAHENSAEADGRAGGYNHGTGSAWHAVPVSVLAAVLKAPLMAASCLWQARDAAASVETRVSSELPLSADEINHIKVHDCMRYAIYV